MLRSYLYPGACRGMVFGGAFAPILSAPGVTPTLRAPGYLECYLFKHAKLVKIS